MGSSSSSSSFKKSRRNETYILSKNPICDKKLKKNNRNKTIQELPFKNNNINNNTQVKKDKQKLKSFKNLKCVRAYFHNDIISSLIPLRNGFMAVASYNSNILHIINLNINFSFKQIKTFKKITCLLEFESNMILTVVYSMIYLWDIRDYDFAGEDYICYYAGHKKKINCLIKYNKNIFASCSDDGTIRCWSYNGKNQIKKISEPNKKFMSLIKLFNGNLCSFDDSSIIKIWDFKTGNCLNIINGHKNKVNCICQFNDGMLLSGSNDKTIKSWKHNQIMFSLDLNEPIQHIIKIDNNFFIVVNGDKNAKIFDKRKLVCVYEFNKKRKFSYFFKLKNNQLLAYVDNKIMLFDNI